MAWFKVDDGFHSHPKAMKAGTSAIGLWARCGSWSSDHSTDGFIPQEIAELYGSVTMARRLVVSGLWSEVDGGYSMHDFLDFNPSKADVVRDREAARERMQAVRERKRSGNVRPNTSRTSDEVRVPRPDPTPGSSNLDTPNPAGAGNCKAHPDAPGSNCRACGTNLRAINGTQQRKPSPGYHLSLRERMEAIDREIGETQ